LIRNNLLANYAAQAFVAVIAFAFVPVYVNLLGIEAYGVVGFFALLLAGMAVLDGGFAPALNREVARIANNDRDIHAVVRLVRSFEVLSVAGFFLVFIAIFYFSSWLSSEWLNADDIPVGVVRFSIILMGGVIALRIFEVVYKSVVLGLQRQVIFSLFSVVLALVRHAGAAIVLVFYGASLEAFFAWQIVASFVSVIVYGLLVYKALPMCGAAWVVDFSYLRSVGGFAGGTFVAAVLAFFLGQLDKIFLSRLISLEEFSYYSIAAALASVISLLVAPVSQAAYPYLVATRDGAHKHFMYRRFFQLVLVVLIPFSLVLSVFSEEILYAWAGSHSLAQESWRVLSLLALGNLLSGLMVLPFVMEYAEGRAGLVVKFNFFALVFVFFALLFLIPQLGAIGGAWAWFSLNVIYFFGMGWVVNNKVCGLNAVKWFFRDACLSFAAALVVIVSVRFYTLPLVSGRWLSVLVALFAWVAGVLVVGSVLHSVRTYFLMGLRFILVGFSR